MQETRVWPLIWENPTCLRAIKPMYHSYWAHALGRAWPERDVTWFDFNWIPLATAFTTDSPDSEWTPCTRVHKVFHLLWKIRLSKSKLKKKKKKNHQLVYRFCCSVIVMSNSFVTPWTIAGQAPLSIGFSSKNMELGAISFSRGSSQPENWTRISYASCIGRRILYHCSTWKAPPGT